MHICAAAAILPSLFDSRDNFLFKKESSLLLVAGFSARYERPTATLKRECVDVDYLGFVLKAIPRY